MQVLGSPRRRPGLAVCQRCGHNRASSWWLGYRHDRPAFNFVDISSFGAMWAQSAARKTLTRLNEQVGAAGLVAAAAVPGLAAVVDQHSAAVRDILTAGVEQSAAVAGVVLLAGYARGLIDQATEQGQQIAVPVDTKGWARADWLSVRLLAICALARTVDEPGPRADGPDALPPH